MLLELDIKPGTIAGTTHVPFPIKDPPKPTPAPLGPDGQPVTTLGEGDDDEEDQVSGVEGDV